MTPGSKRHKLVPVSKSAICVACMPARIGANPRTTSIVNGRAAVPTTAEDERKQLDSNKMREHGGETAQIEGASACARFSHTGGYLGARKKKTGSESCRAPALNVVLASKSMTYIDIGTHPYGKPHSTEFAAACHSAAKHMYDYANQQSPGSSAHDWLGWRWNCCRQHTQSSSSACRASHTLQLSARTINSHHHLSIVPISWQCYVCRPNGLGTFASHHVRGQKREGGQRGWHSACGPCRCRNGSGCRCR